MQEVEERSGGYELSGGFLEKKRRGEDVEMSVSLAIFVLSPNYR